MVSSITSKVAQRPSTWYQSISEEVEVISSVECDLCVNFYRGLINSGISELTSKKKEMMKEGKYVDSEHDLQWRMKKGV